MKWIGKFLDFLKALLKYSSAEERKKRREIAYNDSVKKAIYLQELHYLKLFNFLNNFVEKRLRLNKEDLKRYRAWKRVFEKDRNTFLKLT